MIFSDAQRRDTPAPRTRPATSSPTPIRFPLWVRLTTCTTMSYTHTINTPHGAIHERNSGPVNPHYIRRVTPEFVYPMNFAYDGLDKEVMDKPCGPNCVNSFS